MPISTDDTYTPIAVGDRRDRNPNQYNPIGAELARQLGVEYDPEKHNIGPEAESLVSNPQALEKYKELLKLYEKRHNQRSEEFRREALKGIAALALTAVTIGAASGAFAGGAGTAAAGSAAPATTGAVTGAGKGAIAIGAAGKTAGTTAVLGTAAAPAATGSGLAMASVPTISTGATAGGLAAYTPAAVSAGAGAGTMTVGGSAAAGGMFANMSTSQWLKMGLSTASSAYSAYEENKSKKEQAEFMQKEARRMQQWEADRINRIRTGPLSKIAPFIMQDALNIYGGRGSRMDINTVMNMMGVADLSGMTPFTGFGGGQQSSIPNGNNAAAKAMGA